MRRTERLPNGVGLGLRWDFLEEVLEGDPLDVAFFEVSPENYMRRGGYFPAALERIRERYSLSTHGLTLSLGALAEPSTDYLTELRTEIERLGAPFHSDHLSFTSSGDLQFHELLPLTFSKENVIRVADRLDRTSDTLGVPLAFENITYYAHPGRREFEEAEFITAILERSQAGLLLDVNNVWVNAQNHGFDPFALISALPLDRVVELHVAGHERSPDGLVLDTHGAPVVDPVQELLEFTLARVGPVPLLLERDNNVPELPVLLAEVAHLKALYERAVNPTKGTEKEPRAGVA
jgi:uncharacterized protein (UPF0276 family)